MEIITETYNLSKHKDHLTMWFPCPVDTSTTQSLYLRLRKLLGSWVRKTVKAREAEDWGVFWEPFNFLTCKRKLRLYNYLQRGIKKELGNSSSLSARWFLPQYLITCASAFSTSPSIWPEQWEQLSLVCSCVYHHYSLRTPELPLIPHAHIVIPYMTVGGERHFLYILCFTFPKAFLFVI